MGTQLPELSAYANDFGEPAPEVIRRARAALDVAIAETLLGHPDTGVQLVLSEPTSDVDEHGRARGGRLPARWLRLALVVLLVAAAGAAIFEVSKSSPRRDLPTGTLTAEIAQLAVNAASGDHDNSPGTVTWVATTRDAANQLLWDVSMLGVSDPVYLLEITPGGGTFTPLRGCDSPAELAKHKSCAIRAVLDLVIDRQTGSALDVGFTRTAKLLTSLGSPETDSLAGISPDPSFTWRPPMSALAREIDQFAVDRAAAAGNPHPHSVTWVATTFGAASVVANGGTVSSANATGSPAYVLVVTGGGDFTFYGAHGPPGETAPTGPTLVIIVDQTSWQMDGGGVNFAGAPPLDLASLGTPETDSLAGITPMSFSQFSVKYKLPSSTS